MHTERKVTFWYGARSLREAFYVEDFDAIAAENDNFEWHLALSEPLPEDNWDGLHRLHPPGALRQLPEGPSGAGRLRVLHLRSADDERRRACEMLDDLGVEPENILFDDFGG